MNKNFIKILSLIVAACILAVSFGYIVKAAFNEKINYQGKVTNASGVAIADGDYCMQFVIYDAATLGNALWTETWTAANAKVTTTSGLFSIMLGSHESLSSLDFNQNSLYLEVQLDVACDGAYEEVFSPRKQMGSVPAAFESKQLGGYTWASPAAIGTGTASSGTFTALTGTSITDSGLTATRVTYAGTAGLLSDSAAFTFASGNLTLGAASTATGKLSIKGTTSGTVDITTADAAGTWTLTLPANDGDNGQVLTTNGSGVTSWAAASAPMVYPGAGIAVSTGSAWGTSITDSSSNWNAAYTHKTTEDAINGLVFVNGAGTYSAKAIGTDVQAYDAELAGLAGLSYASGTPFVKMTAAGTFALDTNTYLTSSSGANTALSNLASVAINTSLISDTDSTDNLGSSSIYWANTYTDSITMSETTSSTIGVIFKGANSFIHNYNPPVNAGAIDPVGYNTFVGESAGNFTMGSTAVTTLESSYNTGIGYLALFSNTRGQFNTAVGATALRSNSTGTRNNAFGLDALNFNTSGSQNVVMGTGALTNNTTGNYLVAIGDTAGSDIADDTTDNTTSDYSIYIGADTKALADNGQNEIVIGYNAIGLGSNTVVLGNSSITTTALRGSVGIGTTAPTGGLEVNSATGANLRLTYNDADGSATYYADFLTSSSGDLTISPSGNNTTLQNDVDAVTGMQFLDADGGTPIVNIDTTNERVGIGTAAPTTALDLVGNLTLESTTSSSNGVIYKGANSFIHNYNPPSNGSYDPVGYNTFVGELAGNFTMGSTAEATADASYNTGVGYVAADAITIGRSNSAFGSFALTNNTLGDYNTAIGASALRDTISGISNTMVGAYAGGENETGSYNTGIGDYSLNAGTAANYNTAVGNYSLFASAADYNTAIGSYALHQNSLGTYNGALGYNAGRYITDGSTVNSTSGTSLYLGASTKSLANNDQNEIVIGYNAVGLGSNTVRLGNSSILTTALMGNVGMGTTTPTNARLVVSGGIIIGADALNNRFDTTSGGTGSTTMYIGNSTINVTAPSDIKTKEDITPAVYGLEDLMKFDVKEFKYKKQYVNEGAVQQEHTGLIAQDVEEIYPEAIIHRSDGLIAIDYTKLIPLIIKSIQDLNNSGGLSKSGQWGNGNVSTISTSSIRTALASLGLSLSNGVATMKKADIEVVKIKKMEMTDEVTGETYCTWIANGEWQKTKGECSISSSATETQTTQTNTPATNIAETSQQIEEPQQETQNNNQPAETSNTETQQEPTESTEQAPAETSTEEPQFQEETPVEQTPAETPAIEEASAEQPTEQPAEAAESGAAGLVNQVVKIIIFIWNEIPKVTKIYLGDVANAFSSFGHWMMSIPSKISLSISVINSPAELSNAAKTFFGK